MSKKIKPIKPCDCQYCKNVRWPFEKGTLDKGQYTLAFPEKGRFNAGKAISAHFLNNGRRVEWTGKKWSYKKV